MAKASKEDIDALNTFFSNVESKLEEGISDDVLGRYLHTAMICGRLGTAWRRVVLGCDILIDSCCDPDKTYLDWKPELKEVLPPTHNDQGERLYYVISYKHGQHGQLKFWRPNDSGYTADLSRAGTYTERQIRSNLPYYHNGERSVAVPVGEIHAAPYHIEQHVDLIHEKQVEHQWLAKYGILDITEIEGLEYNAENDTWFDPKRERNQPDQTS